MTRIDPLLRLRGSGKGLWPRRGVDEYVQALRSGWEPVPSPTRARAKGAKPDLLDVHGETWNRLKAHQRKMFRTKTGKGVSYTIEPGGLYFYHAGGHRIEMFSSRSEIFKAIDRCPLATTTAIADLRNPSYVWAVLMDPRIRREDW